MKSHADRNNIWDICQHGTCSGALDTVNQLLADSSIMAGVRTEGFSCTSDYRNTYDTVRLDPIDKVYRWIGIREQVLKVLQTLMEG